MDLYFEYCWKHKSFWLLGKRVPVVENMVQCSIISDSQNLESIFRTFDDYDSCLNCKQKAPLHLNLFGEYFQSIRILFKHCGHNRKNTNKEDCRVKSESEQIEQDCRAESESGQNFGPLSTTPPSPRAPPAGLLPPLQLPGPGDCKAGYLLPGKEQKPVNILPSATSWLQLE